VQQRQQANKPFTFDTSESTRKNLCASVVFLISVFPGLEWDLLMWMRQFSTARGINEV
jgi:hypothetical protein